MAKVIAENEIRKMYRDKKVDRSALKKIESKPAQVPSGTSKDESLMSALLDHVKGLISSSESIVEANRKVMLYIIENQANMNVAMNKKDNGSKEWVFNIERGRDGFISKVNARTVN